MKKLTPGVYDQKTGKILLDENEIKAYTTGECIFELEKAIRSKFGLLACDVKIVFPNDTKYIRDMNTTDYKVKAANIVEVYIPKNVIVIDNWAFSRTGLGKVEFESGRTEKLMIGQFAFSRTPLKELNLPTKTELGLRAFAENYFLERVSIPNDVAESDNVFENCIALKTVKYNARVIGNGMFKDCSDLKEVILGSNVRVIGKNAFNGCTSLEHIDLNKVTNFWDFAFSNTKIKELDCPNVKHIDNYSLDGSDIRKITFDKCVSVHHEAFFSSNVEEITFYQNFRMYPADYYFLDLDKQTKIIRFGDIEACKTYDWFKELQISGVKIKGFTIDELIDEGKSMTEINEVFKNVNDRRTTETRDL